jgi:hypothetical protein
MAKKSIKKTNETPEQARNEDPLSKEPGAHPVGTGVGAALGGAAAGAAAGMVAGPVGTVAGAVVGGVAGAYAGKAVAENIDPTVETKYWRENYPNRPYYDPELEYEEYEPAYRLGWEGFEAGKTFEDREDELEARWNRDFSQSEETALDWKRARVAAQDAYDRNYDRFNKKPR